VSTPPILRDGGDGDVENDVSTPSALSIPPPTDSQPSAAAFAPPSFALPGLRSDPTPDDVDAHVVEVVEDADELKRESNEALDNLREVERLEVELGKTAADYAGVAAGVVPGGDDGDHQMEEVTVSKDGVDKENQLEQKVEQVPLPNEDTVAELPVDEGAATTIAAVTPPQQQDESDAEGEIDLEMDTVDQSADESMAAVATEELSEPTPIAPESAPAPAAPPTSTTPTETPRTPPVTRRPPNLQRRSPTYDAGPPPPPAQTAVIAARGSLPPRPPAAATATGVDHPHARRS